MAELALSEDPPSAPKLRAAVDSAETFVGKAVRRAAESVIHDGATLVAHDASVGARIEAGLNLVADAASFASGPEDIIAERAAVLAIKQTATHAPEIITGAFDAGKQLVVKSPAIAKAAGVVFERTKGLLEKAGHQVVDSQPKKGLIETKQAVYQIVEGKHIDFARLGGESHDAYKRGKNFSVHAPNLGDEDLGKLARCDVPADAKLRGRKADIATSEGAVEDSIAEMEKGRGVKEFIERHQKALGTSATIAGGAIKYVADHTQAGQKLEQKIDNATTAVLQATESAVAHALDRSRTPGETSHAVHKSEPLPARAGRGLHPAGAAGPGGPTSTLPGNQAPESIHIRYGGHVRLLNSPYQQSGTILSNKDGIITQSTGKGTAEYDIRDLLAHAEDPAAARKLLVAGANIQVSGGPDGLQVMEIGHDKNRELAQPHSR